MIFVISEGSMASPAALLLFSAEKIAGSGALVQLDVIVLVWMEYKYGFVGRELDINFLPSVQSIPCKQSTHSR